MNTRFLPPILRRGLALSTLPWFRLELPGWFRIAGPLGLCIGEEALWASSMPCGLPVDEDIPIASMPGCHRLSAAGLMREVEAWIETEMRRLDPEAYAGQPPRG